jgi:hypothetical protein
MAVGAASSIFAFSSPPTSPFLFKPAILSPPPPRPSPYQRLAAYRVRSHHPLPVRHLRPRRPRSGTLSISRSPAPPPTRRTGTARCRPRLRHRHRRRRSRRLQGRGPAARRHSHWRCSIRTGMGANRARPVVAPGCSAGRRISVSRGEFPFPCEMRY